MFKFEQFAVIGKIAGAIVGLVFGIVAITVGFWQALVVLVCALIGLLIAKFWSGEIDFVDWYEEFLNKRGKR